MSKIGLVKQFSFWEKHKTVSFILQFIKGHFFFVINGLLCCFIIEN